MVKMCVALAELFQLSLLDTEWSISQEESAALNGSVKVEYVCH